VSGHRRVDFRTTPLPATLKSQNHQIHPRKNLPTQVHPPGRPPMDPCPSECHISGQTDAHKHRAPPPSAGVGSPQGRFQNHAPPRHPEIPNKTDPSSQGPPHAGPRLRTGTGRGYLSNPGYATFTFMNRGDPFRLVSCFVWMGLLLPIAIPTLSHSLQMWRTGRPEQGMSLRGSLLADGLRGHTW